jgi:hypothetical protein
MDNPSSPFMPSGFSGKKPVGSSGSSPRFSTEPKAAKQPGFFQTIFGSSRKLALKAAAQDPKKEAVKPNKFYARQNSEQLNKIAPVLAQSWNKAMPGSFSTRDGAKQAMGRMFGGKGDSWIKEDKIRQMGKAVREGRWGHDSLKGLNPEELSGIKYDAKKREAFVKGIKSLNEKKF